MRKKDIFKRESEIENKKAMPVWQRRLHEIIYEAETPAGRLFDVVLFLLIIASVLDVMMESMTGLRVRYGNIFRFAEWVFTILFTVEYGLRLLATRNPVRYALSFFGIIDFLSVIPTYLSFWIPGAQSLLVVRSLRLLRVFRVLKLLRMSIEAETLWAAVKASRHKVVVFVGTVFMVSIILGTLMYLIEGEASGIPDIPTGIYWAVATVATVGFGDIVPHTMVGKFITTIAMIMGYGLIAVPTGIVSVELAHATRLAISTNACPSCHSEGHDLDAVYCRFCGGKL